MIKFFKSTTAKQTESTLHSDCRFRRLTQQLIHLTCHMVTVYKFKDDASRRSSFSGASRGQTPIDPQLIAEMSIIHDSDYHHWTLIKATVANRNIISITKCSVSTKTNLKCQTQFCKLTQSGPPLMKGVMTSLENSLCLSLTAPLLIVFSLSLRLPLSFQVFRRRLSLDSRRLPRGQLYADLCGHKLSIAF